MIVGEENVGKTSLVKAITASSNWKVVESNALQTQITGALAIVFFMPPRSPYPLLCSLLGDTVSTDGIEITKVVVSYDNSTASNKNRIARFPDGVIDLDVSFWDFAGQELYYSTHQFFISERSVFLLAWSLVKSMEDSRVEFWIHSIASKVKRPVIILVGTHLDGISESELPGIQEVFVFALFCHVPYLSPFLQPSKPRLRLPRRDTPSSGTQQSLSTPQ